MDHLLEFEDFNESSKDLRNKKLQAFGDALKRDNPEAFNKKEEPKSEKTYTPAEQQDAKKEMDILLKHFNPTNVFSDKASVGHKQMEDEKRFRRLFTILNDKDKEYVIKFMKNKYDFKVSVNESNNTASSLYPLKKDENPERYLSGRTVDSWNVKKMSNDDFTDVFGNEVSILSGDSIDAYLLVNSTDNSYIFRVKRRDSRQTRYFYIPSIYQGIDQYDNIYKTN